MKHIAIIGAGWAGLTAAVKVTQAGHVATVFEAAPAWGGRARRVTAQLPDGTKVQLDNGQHILIGAYTQTLQIMRDVGVNLATVLHRTPLRLSYLDGQGMALPQLPSPWNALVGIARARGWRWHHKLSLLRCAAQWQWQNFECAASVTVMQLCQQLPEAVMKDFIEPLCISALNTPAANASGQVFLRVLRDALFGISGGSDLLLPTTDLSSLFPDPAVQWLAHHGASVLRGLRVQGIEPVDAAQSTQRWRVLLGNTHNAASASPDLLFDAVVIASAAPEAARLLAPLGMATQDWCHTAQALHYEAITTVYVYADGARLPHPMLALRSSSGAEPGTPTAPAQFVFDRGQLSEMNSHSTENNAGLLAFVISASQGERVDLQAQVIAQAAQQLGITNAIPIQTIVEKRATFACTPALQRPPTLASSTWPTLAVCGDYIDGAYPATLEGAVISAQNAVSQILQSPTLRG